MKIKRIVIMAVSSCFLCTLLIVCFWLHDTKKYEMEDNTRIDPTPISKEEGITLSVVDNNTLEIKGSGKLDVQGFRIAAFSISYDESKKIRRIVIRDGITELDLDGCLSDINAQETIKEIVIADSVEKIGSSCFSDLYQLTTVNMGNGVQEIGPYAFDSCSSLRDITFSNSLRTIQKGAFKYCGAMEQIHLPESLLEIGKECFSNCRALSRITLPDSVVTVREGAFDECYDLEEMVLSAGLEKWNEPDWDTSALKRIINRSVHIWELGSAKGKKSWYVNGKKTKKIHAGEMAIARGKKYSIKYQLNGGKLIGDMPETYQYGEICPISATVEKEGYYCVGWCDEKHEVWIFYPDFMFISKYDYGDLVLTPLLVQYKVENISGRGIKITLSDTGLPYVQEYYEIRYSENEDMSGAKCKIMDGRSMMIKGLTKGKRYYIEFRWGSDEGNEGEREPLSSWMGKKSVLCQ